MTTTTLPDRKLHYKCPDCEHVQTVTLDQFDTWVKEPPQEETIACRCDRCFSAKLDAAMPGARARYEARVRAEARAAARRPATKARPA